MERASELPGSASTHMEDPADAASAEGDAVPHDSYAGPPPPPLPTLERFEDPLEGAEEEPEPSVSTRPVARFETTDPMSAAENLAAGQVGPGRARGIVPGVKYLNAA